MPSPAGTKPVSMMWPDCSPPSAQPRSSSSASTLRSPTGVVATSTPCSLHRLVEAVVGHDRDRHAVAGQAVVLAQVQRGERDQLVAVHDRAVAVDGEHAVAVAVEGEAEVVAARAWPRELLDVGRAAVAVDVAPVGLDGDRVDVGAEAPEDLGRDPVGGAVGAVEQDPHAVEAQVREARLELAQVVGRRAVQLAHAAHARCRRARRAGARSRPPARRRAWCPRGRRT